VVWDTSSWEGVMTATERQQAPSVRTDVDAAFRG
jgi:hypothetical protein